MEMATVVKAVMYAHVFNQQVTYATILIVMTIINRFTNLSLITGMRMETVMVTRIYQ